jgi:4-hydroxybenzoate polyprenyltransferase
VTGPSSRGRRIARFFGHMFPPAVYVPSSLANFAAIYFSLQAFASEAPLRVGWRALGGATTVLLFTLLLRLYDELKDVESDLRLGRAGDPRFKDRPVVTGAIRVEDLVALRWGTTLALVAINLPLGFPWPFVAFVALFALTWLSFKWFFTPAISRSLLLAFVTHNPLTLAVAGYVIAVYCRDFGADRLTVWTLPLLGAAWFPIAAWETSRKIRPPSEETAYQTYSQVLGWKIAPFLPAGFLLLSATSYLLVARAAGLGIIYPAAVVVSAALAIAACLRFRFAPSAKSAHLRPYVELHAVVASVGLAVALGLRLGIDLG